MRLMLIAAFIWIAASAAPLAQQEGPPTQPGPAAVALFEAYQSGYLQLVAISCFQLYSSTGVVSADFVNGVVDGERAMQMLEHNLLLHSACQTTLADITARTPANDKTALAELGRLKKILDAEGTLFNALSDFFAGPTQETSDAAKQALAAVEAELDDYTKSSGPEKG